MLSLPKKHMTRIVRIVAFHFYSIEELTRVFREVDFT